MATQTPVILLNAGGGLSPRQVKKYLCQAFRAAVKDYCKKPKGKRGSFNNDFYNKLRGYKKSPFPFLAQALKREMPVLTGNGFAGTAEALVAGGGPGAGVAQAALSAYSDFVTNTLKVAGGTITGATPIAIGSSLGVWTLKGVSVAGTPFWTALGNLGGRLKYPDGLINNQVMEIKGPGDFFKDPTQRQAFNDVSAPNAPIIVNCRSCKAKCENGPSKTMSKGAKRNAGCS